MSTSEILIYQNPDSNIKIDIHLEEKTVWLRMKINVKFSDHKT